MDTNNSNKTKREKPNRYTLIIVGLLCGICSCISTSTSYFGGGTIGFLFQWGPPEWIKFIVSDEPFLGVMTICCSLGFLFSILGIVLGIIGLNTSKGRKLAITGLILSIISIALGLVGAIFGIIGSFTPA